jgi:hypothetical protein
MDTRNQQVSTLDQAPEQASRIPVPGVFAVGELQHDISLLRDQVDALQIAAAEKKRPWYRDHSVLLSLLALLFSTVFSIFSVYQAVQQNQIEASDKAREIERSKLEGLRQFMLQLATIRADEIQDQGTIAQSNPVLFNQRSSVRNLQRQIILESADAIAAVVKDSVSAQVYNALAFEHSTDGRYQDAERYYIAAMKASADSGNSMLVSLQGLAGLYMTPQSSIADVQKGRQYYHRAMEILARQSDETSHYRQAQVYMQFAWMEVTNGNRTEAAELIRTAREHIAALNPQNPARRQLTASIDTYFDARGLPKS